MVIPVNSLTPHQVPKRSGELEDNRIGDFPELHTLNDRLESLLDTGYKWQKIELLKDGINDGRFWEVDWLTEEYRIDPADDDAITDLANSGVSLVACLGCLPDEDGFAERGRFKTEEEIQQYLNYARQVAAHFKGRIQYYEIWNEPNVQTPNWFVELPDYINLISLTIPVILEKDPGAKFVVGSTTPPDNPDSREYLLGVLRSNIMPLVDVVSWHPMFGTSPEYDCCKDYYYEYPSIVQEIKDVASAYGFTGDYYAAEINWAKTDFPLPPVTGQPRYSEIVSAKYYARGIMMHLGMDVIAGIIDWGDNPTQLDVTRHLSTLMAGAKAASLPLEIKSEAMNIASYSFSLSNGDYLLALWTDGVAVEIDPGIIATLTLPNFSAGEVVGIDILYGLVQQLNTITEDGNLVVRDLLIKDYPIILSFKNASSP